MKKIIIVLAVLVVALLGYVFMRQPVIAPTIENNTASAEKPLVSSVSPASEGVTTKPENENIKITSPVPNAKLTSPFTVAGEARVFENVVNIRVTNAKGETMIQETGYAKAPDAGQFGPFSVNISYQFKNTKEGFVEVYHASAKDGSDQDLIRIPVTFE